jgi:hypothetical protein
MRNRTHALALTLALSAAGALNAQTIGEIQGSVLAPDGSPAYGAVVEVQNGGGRIATTADMEGRFVLKPLIPGTYTVRFSSTEFAPFEYAGVVVNPDKITFLRNMRGDAKELGTLVITKHIWEPPLIDPEEPGKTTLIHTQIKRDPTRKNLVKLASTAGPGVYKAPNSDDLYFKGARADAMVYFVDGVKMNTLTGVPPDAVNSISVYTGGVPAKYGDFTGGVIAIETKTYFDLYRQRQAGIR